MKYSPHIWGQLKNLTADDLVGALRRDGWELDAKRGAEQVYRSPGGRRVSIHYHPGKIRSVTSFLGSVSVRFDNVTVLQ